MSAVKIHHKYFILKDSTLIWQSMLELSNRCIFFNRINNFGSKIITEFIIWSLEQKHMNINLMFLWSILRVTTIYICSQSTVERLLNFPWDLSRKDDKFELGDFSADTVLSGPWGPRWRGSPPRWPSWISGLEVCFS